MAQKRNRKFGFAVVAMAVAAVLFIGSNILQGQRVNAENGGAPARTPSPLPSASTSPTPTAGPLSVWFSGDSLTVGVHATTEAEAFRSLVVTELGDRVGETTVTARSGATLQRVADEYEVPVGMDIAVVALGTNDFGTDPALFADQYTAYLDRVVEASPKAQLICLGAWRPSSIPGTSARDAAIWQACTAQGGTYIPLTGLFADASLRGPDGAPTWVGAADTFHPNSAGHRVIADRILASLT
ncbi:SGNH/GDSL hydrolase family protein [Arthrobacter crusticola]|uniref:SGNH/GDSL hydrolase family protein n=1 Tax=Arthrobacter crusticola TaxID=2547960 RepID=UPI001404A59C|nr:SGNH/GDSL hydrolase family protein [Arthrobacter crusticola]